MKELTLLSMILAAFAATPVGADQRPSFDIPSMEDPQSRLSVYSFPEYSIVEVRREQMKHRERLEYAIHVAPPLTDETLDQLYCVDPRSGAYSPRSCDPGLPDLEPDFSTCQDSIGLGESGSCVEVWDMGSFLIVATYSALGILQDIEIEEHDEEEGEDDSQ
jgi:hypothetical protein